MKKRMSLIALGACGVAFIASTTSASSFSGQEGVQPIHVLDTEREAYDRLPEEAANIMSLTEVSAESIRLVGETEETIVWVGENSQGESCVISRLKDDADGHVDDAEIFGATCVDAPVAREEGIALRVQGGKTTGVSMHLLPGEATVESARQLHSEKDRHGGHVIVRGGRTLVVAPVESAYHLTGLNVDLKTGESLDLQLIGRSTGN